MTWIEWLLGIVGSILVAAMIWVSNVLSKLPLDYVPRSQVESRFRDLEARLHNDLRLQEERTDKRFDKIDAKLDQIISRLDSKADK